MDKVELEVAVVRKGTSIPRLAEALGMNKTTFYRKLESGKFDRGEIEGIRDALGLTNDDLLRIFFGGESCGNAT